MHRNEGNEVPAEEHKPVSRNYEERCYLYKIGRPIGRRMEYILRRHVTGFTRITTMFDHCRLRTNVPRYAAWQKWRVTVFTPWTMTLDVHRNLSWINLAGLFGIWLFIGTTGFFGKALLLSLAYITQVNRHKKEMHVALSRDVILSAPEYRYDQAITREYEASLFKHYGLRTYWESG
jgi:hypothetical protein